MTKRRWPVPALQGATFFIERHRPRLPWHLAAMAPEGTPGKWSLWATHPERLGGVAELYATTAAAAVRAADLRQAGYTVEIFLSRSDWRSLPI
jgi:hypothetical protein